jgi:hypothetical protein
MVLCASWLCISSGTRQMLLTSCIVSTFCGGTWQNKAWQQHKTAATAAAAAAVTAVLLSAHSEQAQLQ